MDKATQSMLIYALIKNWDSVVGLNESMLIQTATSYYLAGARDNETKTTIDDIYQAL